jgi:Tol biopolymer transport system component
MKLLSKLFIFLFLVPGLAYAQAGLDTLSLKSIFYEPLLAGNRPDMISFSPDLTHIYYQTNDSSMADEETFQVDLNGQNRQLAPDKIERRFKVSPNGDKLVYSDRADIWIADLNFENKEQLIDSKVREYNATWSPDSRSIAFIQNGDVWILNINNSKLTQVTEKTEDEPDHPHVDHCHYSGAVQRIFGKPSMTSGRRPCV